MENLEKKVGIKIKDAEKYYDLFVVVNPLKDNEVIAYGKDPGKVIDEARKKGIEVPAILYVFNPNTTYALISKAA